MSLTPITHEDAVDLLDELAPELRADWERVLDLADSWQIGHGDVDHELYSPDGAVIVRGKVALTGDLLINCRRDLGSWRPPGQGDALVFARSVRLDQGRVVAWSDDLQRQ